MKKVRRLRAGSPIAIVSPSWGGPSRYPAIFDAALENLRMMGLVPVEFPTTSSRPCRSRVIFRGNELYLKAFLTKISSSNFPYLVLLSI